MALGIDSTRYDNHTTDPRPDRKGPHVPDSANLGNLERLDVSGLALFHKNPRRGNVDAIVDSIRANGIYKPIVVNRGSLTGRPNEVLAGNHTVQAVRRLAEEEPDDARWSALDAYVVDVDEENASRIVVVDNRTSDLAATDDRTLLELLSTLDDVDGTGYVEDDVDDLRAMLEEMGDDEPVAVPREVTDSNGETVYTYDDDDEEEEDEDRPSGLLNNSADADNMAKYADRATRMFVLAFPIAQYAWVADALEKVADDYDLDTNSDVLLHLLSAYTDEEPPAVATADEDEEADE